MAFRPLNTSNMGPAQATEIPKIFLGIPKSSDDEHLKLGPANSVALTEVSSNSEMMDISPVKSLCSTEPSTIHEHLIEESDDEEDGSSLEADSSMADESTGIEVSLNFDSSEVSLGSGSLESDLANISVSTEESVLCIDTAEGAEVAAPGTSGSLLTWRELGGSPENQKTRIRHFTYDSTDDSTTGSTSSITKEAAADCTKKVGGKTSGAETKTSFKESAEGSHTCPTALVDDMGSTAMSKSSDANYIMKTQSADKDDSSTRAITERSNSPSKEDIDPALREYLDMVKQLDVEMECTAPRPKAKTKLSVETEHAEVGPKCVPINPKPRRHSLAETQKLTVECATPEPKVRRHSLAPKPTVGMECTTPKPSSRRKSWVRAQIQKIEERCTPTSVAPSPLLSPQGFTSPDTFASCITKTASSPANLTVSTEDALSEDHSPIAVEPLLPNSCPRQDKTKTMESTDVPLIVGGKEQIDGPRSPCHVSIEIHTTSSCDNAETDTECIKASLLIGEMEHQSVSPLPTEACTSIVPRDEKPENDEFPSTVKKALDFEGESCHVSNDDTTESKNINHQETQSQPIDTILPTSEDTDDSDSQGSSSLVEEELVTLNFNKRIENQDAPSLDDPRIQNCHVSSETCDRSVESQEEAACDGEQTENNSIKATPEAEVGTAGTVGANSALVAEAAAPQLCCEELEECVGGEQPGSALLLASQIDEVSISKGIDCESVSKTTGVDNHFNQETQVDLASETAESNERKPSWQQSQVLCKIVLLLVAACVIFDGLDYQEMLGRYSMEWNTWKSVSPESQLVSGIQNRRQPNRHQGKVPVTPFEQVLKAGMEDLKPEVNNKSNQILVEESLTNPYQERSLLPLFPANTDEPMGFAGNRTKKTQPDLENEEMLKTEGFFARLFKGKQNRQSQNRNDKKERQESPILYYGPLLSKF